MNLARDRTDLHSAPAAKLDEEDTGKSFQRAKSDRASAAMMLLGTFGKKQRDFTLTSL